MLSLGFNQNMSGGIPDEIGDLYNLEALFLPNMSLKGRLPSSMKNLENLKNLHNCNQIGYEVSFQSGSAT